MLTPIDKVYSFFLFNLKELIPIINCCIPDNISTIGIIIFRLWFTIENIAVKIVTIDIVILIILNLVL
jgi:hypothetical protein